MTLNLITNSPLGGIDCCSFFFFLIVIAAKQISIHNSEDGQRFFKRHDKRELKVSYVVMNPLKSQSNRRNWCVILGIEVKAFDADSTNKSTGAAVWKVYQVCDSSCAFVFCFVGAGDVVPPNMICSSLLSSTLPLIRELCFWKA